MSGIYGADVDQLRALATQFDRSADRLDADRMSVGNGIRISAWAGPVAVRFRAQWDSDHSRRMREAAERLRTAALSLRANADDQARTSAVGTGSATGVGGGGDGSTGSQFGPGTASDDEVIVIKNEHGESIRVARKWTDPEGGLWKTESGSRSGASGEADARAGWDDDGNYRARAGASGELGIGSDEGWRYEDGAVSGGSGFGSFLGARGGAEATGSAGVDGLNARAGANAFIGTEVTARGDIDVGGVGAGINAGLRGGIGADAGVSVSATTDEIKIEAKIGLAVGIGGSVQPSITIKPKKIIEFAESIGWPV
jgi:hypothetical protein